MVLGTLNNYRQYHCVTPSYAMQQAVLNIAESITCRKTAAEVMTPRIVRNTITLKFRQMSQIGKNSLNKTTMPESDSTMQIVFTHGRNILHYITTQIG